MPPKNPAYALDSNAQIGAIEFQLNSAEEGIDPNQIQTSRSMYMPKEKTKSLITKFSKRYLIAKNAINLGLESVDGRRNNTKQLFKLHQALDSTIWMQQV